MWHDVLAEGLDAGLHRIERLMSQEALSFEAGLHRTYISGIERGVRNIGLDSIGVIAKALRCEPSTLLEAKPNGPPTASRRSSPPLKRTRLPRPKEALVRPAGGTGPGERDIESGGLPHRAVVCDRHREFEDAATIAVAGQDHRLTRVQQKAALRRLK